MATALTRLVCWHGCLEGWVQLWLSSGAPASDLSNIIMSELSYVVVQVSWRQHSKIGSGHFCFLKIWAWKWAYYFCCHHSVRESGKLFRFKDREIRLLTLEERYVKKKKSEVFLKPCNYKIFINLYIKCLGIPNYVPKLQWKQIWKQPNLTRYINLFDRLLYLELDVAISGVKFWEWKWIRWYVYIVHILTDIYRLYKISDGKSREILEINSIFDALV